MQEEGTRCLAGWTMTGAHRHLSRLWTSGSEHQTTNLHLMGEWWSSRSWSLTVKNVKLMTCCSKNVLTGCQPSSRTSICSFVRRNDLKWATDLHVSKQTVRNSVGDVGACHPLVGLVLTTQHRAARSAFTTEHLNVKVQHRGPVLFTDNVTCILTFGKTSF